MLIKINEKLEHSILDNVPKEYSNLEKAIWIYRQLCLKTDYSLEYYLNSESEKTIEKFSNPENVQLVDGEENKGVVCTTFCAIYSMLLIKAGIIEENQWDTQNIMGADGKFGHVHAELSLVIDNQTYIIDSSDQILGGSDLTLSKYSILPLTGWEPNRSKTANYEQAEEALKSAIEKVQADDAELTALAKEYMEVKGEDYFHLSLEQRVKLFLDLAKNVPTKYSITSFNFLLKLKHLLFTDAEVFDAGNGHINKNIDVIFVKDMENNEFKAILLYNSAGYTADLGYENFDALKTYVISLKHGKIEKLSVDEVREAFKSGQFAIRQSDTFKPTSKKYMFRKAGIAKVQANYHIPSDPREQ